MGALNPMPPNTDRGADLDEAARFLTLLDPFATRFTFQTFDDRGEDRGLARILHGTLDQCATELQRLNARGAGVYVTVNETDLTGRQTGNIVAVRAVFADLDGTPLEQALAASPIPPHWIVNSSPGKFHLYWRCDGVALEQFSAIQKAIIARLGSDKNVFDLPRVMRLPGFDHQKDAPHRTHIQSVNADISAAYSCDEITKEFGVLAAAPRLDRLARQSQIGGTGSPIIIDAARHEDAVRMSFRTAQTVIATGADPESGLAMIEAEIERGRYTRDVREEALRAYDGALAKLQRGELPKSRAPAGAGLDWPPASLEPDPASATSDVANVERLYRTFGPNFMHVEGLGDFVFDPLAGGWRFDAAQAQVAAAGVGRLVLAEAARLADKARASADEGDRASLAQRAEGLTKWARQSEMAPRINAALCGLRARIAVKAADLDKNPLLLGTPNGVVDLAAGALRPIARSDLITKRTRANFDPSATCPVWERTLERIFRGHPELAGFIQRLLGYFLTGSVGEQILVVAWGTGANGKTTVIDTFADVLGDYAMPAAPGLLMRRKHDAHPAELAELLGRRLVYASESAQEAALDEEKVKRLTGGDTITARRMQQDFFQFSPTHKLVMSTNHRPTIRGADEGIWRRLCLVPFAEKIPEPERDPNLRDKLLAERDGILAWAVRGCSEYLRDGLSRPDAVRDATNEYRRDSDPVSRFIDDECVLGTEFYTSSADLFTAFESWCAGNGETCMSQRRFSDRIAAAGIKSERSKSERGWRGIGRPFG